MKLKFLFLPVIFAIVLLQIFSSQCNRLDETQLSTRPGPQGNPVVQVEGVSYFVRDWQPAAGCYRLIDLKWIEYHLAWRVNSDRCSGESRSG